jgi:hypothetical protein
MEKRKRGEGDKRHDTQDRDNEEKERDATRKKEVHETALYIEHMTFT